MGFKILYIEDDPGVSRLVQKRLSRSGMLVEIASSGLAGLEIMANRQFDLVLLDFWLPDLQGLEVLARIQTITSPPPVVLVTGAGKAESAVLALKQGALDYLIKDGDGAFIRKIEHNLQDWISIHHENVEQKHLIADLKNYAQTVAHDLKNPLSTLKALTSLLAIEENDEQEIAKYASAIVGTVEKMRNIVDELLLMASTKKEEIQIEEIQMEGIIQQAIDRLGYLVRDRGASIEIVAPLPAVLGYPAWVEEVWVNYLSNALKYGGEQPRIEIDAECLSNGRVRFWVIDHGPGIPLEKQDSLFQPLTRLSHSQANGHGLGLSIVRRIIEKLDGETGVESLAGEGARFYFTLPMAPVDNSFPKLNPSESNKFPQPG